MVENLDRVTGKVPMRKCPCCGVEAQYGASFCAKCGNALGAKIEATELRKGSSFAKAKCPTTIWQKLTWVLVGAVLSFGLYVFFGNRMTATDSAGSAETAEGGEVTAAERKLEDLQRSIADEDARRLAAERAAQEKFRKSQEAVDRLRSAVEGKKSEE